MRRPVIQVVALASIATLFLTSCTTAKPVEYTSLTGTVLLKNSISDLDVALRRNDSVRNVYLDPDTNLCHGIKELDAFQVGAPVIVKDATGGEVAVGRMSSMPRSASAIVEDILNSTYDCLMFFSVDRVPKIEGIYRISVGALERVFTPEQLESDGWQVSLEVGD